MKKKREVPKRKANHQKEKSLLLKNLLEKERRANRRK